MFPLDAFRTCFNLYKKRDQSPDFHSVVDFCDNGSLKTLNYTIEFFKCRDAVNVSDFIENGLLSPDVWSCHTFKEKPGFVHVSNPFTRCRQMYWMRRCVKDFPHPPNVTNISSLAKKKGLNYFNSDCFTELSQLRWTTLGQHYNWDEQTYFEDQHTPVPKDLESLGSLIGQALGYPQFLPEAAILNYYHLNSTLGIHTDHSEDDLSQPIISISLGQNAIFLLGGQMREESPIPILVRSGDIVIMGNECRLAYHAVPRVYYTPDAAKRWTDTRDNTLIDDIGIQSNLSERISNQDSKELTETCLQTNIDMENSPCNEIDVGILEYMSKSRINISLRKLYK